jgi:hypothetical protein
MKLRMENKLRRRSYEYVCADRILLGRWGDNNVGLTYV